MAKFNPLTSSERRGILIVAAISLLITGFGLFYQKDNDNIVEEFEQTEIIVPSDTTTQNRESKKTDKKDRKKKNKKGSRNKKKTYLKRSPLDEPVD